MTSGNTIKYSQNLRVARLDRPDRPDSASSKVAWGELSKESKASREMYAEFDRPDDALGAMEAEQIVDGHVVVNQEVREEEPPKPAKPPGCCACLVGVIRSLWATRETEDTDEDKELYIKTTLRELVVYIVFIVVLMIFTFAMTSTVMFYYTQVMTQLFLDTSFVNSTTSFRTSTTIADFWRFCHGPLMGGLYWDTWYNGLAISPDNEDYIYYENKLLGVPRIRQLRVRPDSCTIADDFKLEIKDCFSSYSESVEDKLPFGLMSSTAWNYSTAKETKGSDFTGLISSYSGAGYYIDLTRNKSESLKVVHELFENLWIRRGTRVVFIDFTVYNANINLFCVIKCVCMCVLCLYRFRLIMEFPATGGAVPSWDFRTVKLIRYVSPMDYFVLACEIIFCGFLIYYIIEEAIEIRRHRWQYFKSFWNWLDIIVIVISIICMLFNFYRAMKVGETLQQLLKNTEIYPDFDFLSYWQQNYNYAIAVTVFFSWIKIFKYISFNKTMMQLSSTLARCAKDLLGFFIMFCIIFFAFAQLGYLIFGTQVRDFREFHHSVFTLFRIILGDFNFHELESAHRILGPLFFMLYVFFVFFVLINMFLAIINDTYSEVKNELANQQDEFNVGDFLKKRANEIADKLTFSRDKIDDITKVIMTADTNFNGQVDFNEWRTQMKTRGYADLEIEAAFAKYDLDGDRVLDNKEQKRMKKELQRQRNALTEEIEREKHRAPSAKSVRSVAEADERDGGDNDDADDDSDDGNGGDASKTKPMGFFGGGGGPGDVKHEEFGLLERRVDRMEQSVGGIVIKIDAVLLKLQQLEKTKVRRRHAMSKIMDSIAQFDGLMDSDKRRELERLVSHELKEWEHEHTPEYADDEEDDLRPGTRPVTARSK